MASWALAVWDGWFSHQVISSTFFAAKERLLAAGDNVWLIVKGPATALQATMSRLGWSMRTPFEVTSDIGQSFDFTRDPPVAVATAAIEGVRRWRWRQAGQIILGLIPTRADSGSGAGASDDLIIGCFGGVNKLLRA
jgi:hypothetical protein